MLHAFILEDQWIFYLILIPIEPISQTIHIYIFRTAFKSCSYDYDYKISNLRPLFGFWFYAESIFSSSNFNQKRENVIFIWRNIAFDEDISVGLFNKIWISIWNAFLFNAQSIHGYIHGVWKLLIVSEVAQRIL